MNLIEALHERMLKTRLARVKRKREFKEKISTIENDIETERAIIDNLQSKKPKRENKLFKGLVKLAKGVERIEAPTMPGEKK